MVADQLTRRGAIAAAIGGTLTVLTGCDSKTGNAVGDGLVAIGGVALKIPHWFGKLVGIVLLSGGTALKFYFRSSDGVERDVEIELTEEQRKKIEAAIAKGHKFKVTDPNGNDSEHHDGK